MDSKRRDCHLFSKFIKQLVLPLWLKSDQIKNILTMSTLKTGGTRLTQSCFIKLCMMTNYIVDY